MKHIPHGKRLPIIVVVVYHVLTVAISLIISLMVSNGHINTYTEKSSSYFNITLTCYLFCAIAEVVFILFLDLFLIIRYEQDKSYSVGVIYINALLYLLTGLPVLFSANMEPYSRSLFSMEYMLTLSAMLIIAFALCSLVLAIIVFFILNGVIHIKNKIK